MKREPAGPAILRLVRPLWLLATLIWGTIVAFFSYAMLIGLWGLPYLMGEEIAFIGAFYLGLFLVVFIPWYILMKRLHRLERALLPRRVNRLKRSYPFQLAALGAAFGCVLPLLILGWIGLPFQLLYGLLPGLFPLVLVKSMYALTLAGLVSSAAAVFFLATLRLTFRSS